MTRLLKRFLAYLAEVIDDGYSVGDGIIYDENDNMSAGK